MTRLAVLSDIHGVWPALESVLEDLSQFRVDHVIVGRVRFDYSLVFREFERQGFIEECGVVAYLVVQTLITSRPQITPFLRWREHRYPGEPLDREMLAEYLLHAPWEQYVEPAYLLHGRSEDSSRDGNEPGTERRFPLAWDDGTTS